MRTLPNNAPTNVAALDLRDPRAGNASHEYGIQWGGPKDVTRVQFQHGARGLPDSTAGVFDEMICWRLCRTEWRVSRVAPSPVPRTPKPSTTSARRARRWACVLRVGSPRVFWGPTRLTRARRPSRTPRKRSARRWADRLT